MEIDCLRCGSLCQVDFDPANTTEETPSFCPFCGEPVEVLNSDEEAANYIGRIFDQGSPDE